MKRPAWMDGPLFDLKPMFIHAYVWLMVMTLGCILAVVIKQDVWLLAAMAPGVLMASTIPWFFDKRFKQVNSEAVHEGP